MGRAEVYDPVRAGEGISRLRRKAGLTESELAGLAGMDGCLQVEAIEAGEGTLTADAVWALSRALGTDPNAILCWRRPPLDDKAGVGGVSRMKGRRHAYIYERILAVIGRGGGPAGIVCTRRELALAAGCSRALASRGVKRLRDDGLIRTRQRMTRTGAIGACSYALTAAGRRALDELERDIAAGLVEQVPSEGKVGNGIK